ncbi:ABC transporter permease subunit (plasmid) [Polaromonas sp. P1-6]|nr:ABC transporter permease subunit [Polaromonas sp. P1-6]
MVESVDSRDDGPRRWFDLASSPFRRLWWLVVLLVFWDLYVRVHGFNVIVLPDPWTVAITLWADWPTLLEKLTLTMRAAILGLVLGALLGTVVAIIAWSSRLASGLVGPFAIAVRTIPFIVLIPILSRVMGYNSTMEIVVVTMLSFFPSFVLVSSGLHGLPAAASDLCEVFGATRWRKLTLIALPAALPKLFTSIRLSAPHAVLGAMVAEFLTGLDGLGRLFLLARGDLEAERALAAAAVAAIAALALFHFAQWAEQYVNRKMA